MPLRKTGCERRIGRWVACLFIWPFSSLPILFLIFPNLRAQRINHVFMSFCSRLYVVLLSLLARFWVRLPHAKKTFIARFCCCVTCVMCYSYHLTPISTPAEPSALPSFLTRGAACLRD